MVWDVLSGVAKMAWAVLSRVKTHTLLLMGYFTPTKISPSGSMIYIRTYEWKLNLLVRTQELYSF